MSWAQLTPPSTGGIVALDRLLANIAEQRRVLMIAAHPDDEDTGVLALFSLGRGAKTGYLSLSRGEGGQNLIGQELGPGLGLIRSRELLAARELDGGQQFFTRAYDYGFSRTLDEAQRFWTPDSVLKDVVRVIRKFRPHVVISIFSGTPRDGHGQHQLAGWITPLAFAAASDPNRFPELKREEGLDPWRPLKLYRSTRFNQQATTVPIETGVIDPAVGKTYAQIAAASRSRHRSQDMGQLQTLGPARTGLALVEDRTGRSTNGMTGSSGEAGKTTDRSSDVFNGIPNGDADLVELADSLLNTVVPSRLSDATLQLSRALTRLRGASPNASVLGDVEKAIAVSAGVVLDATTKDEDLVAGQKLDVEVTAFNGGSLNVTLDSVRLEVPSGWQVQTVEPATGSIGRDQVAVAKFAVTVSLNARLSQPYFLERPLVGWLYDWSTAAAAVRGEPFEPPLIHAVAFTSIAGTRVPLRREVAYRFNDQATGEVRRPLRVVPAIDVKLEPLELIWPADGDSSHVFAVTLTNNGVARQEGELVVQAGDWPAPAPVRFSFEQVGESRVVNVILVRPRGFREGRVPVRAAVRTETGGRFGDGIVTIDYPHIRRSSWARQALGEIRVTPVRLPDVKRVAYVRGASDRVPEALSQIGLPIEILDADQLERGDLSQFDAIVVGSRAYETDPALARHNDRLLQYVKAGGHVVVQYQQYQFVRGNYAPYPLTIANPHDRVTDETAPVKILDPNSPVVNTPNPIVPGDWDGWPQERGLYFAHSWDGQYRVVLESGDPGMEPLTGGLLVASYGSGTYVYTGLSFFRALPAGVPGAYKLFLNLIGLKNGGI